MTKTKVASLVCCLGEVDDPRKPSNGTLHDFLEILVIAIAAVLSDCDTIEDIAEWGRTKEAWLRQFLVLKNGVASEEDVSAHLPGPRPEAIRGGVPPLGGWGGRYPERRPGVDGKTVRGSGSGGESAIHMVSAFATELGIVLGQEKVASKSNEITAIPELLKALYIHGLLVTIDAMGCQKNIARQITDQGGDYLLAVKGNQPTLLDAIETEFIDQSPSEEVDRHRQVHTVPWSNRRSNRLGAAREKGSLIWPIGPNARRSLWSIPCARSATMSRSLSGATTSALVN
jgi:predicted transposase YbfD/YdcC